MQTICIREIGAGMMIYLNDKMFWWGLFIACVLIFCEMAINVLDIS